MLHTNGTFILSRMFTLQQCFSDTGQICERLLILLLIWPQNAFNKQVGLLLQLKNVLIIGGGKEKRKY